MNAVPDTTPSPLCASTTATLSLAPVATDSTSWEFAVSTSIKSAGIMSKSAAGAFHFKRIRPHPLGVCLRAFRFICLRGRFA